MAPRIRKNPHAVALGRRGGKSSSDAKAEAARQNGLLGGRPRLKKATRARLSKAS